MSKEELLVAISKTEEDLKNKVVYQCEVYSRVVGYYRPVVQWNAGKQEEWKFRAKFDSVVEAAAS